MIAVIILTALVAGMVLVGDERRRAGDIGLEPGRRRRAVDDLPYRVDGLVGQASPWLPARYSWT